MSESTENKTDFIGYEYKNITAKRDIYHLYADYFPSFGWVLEESKSSHSPTVVTMKFKRDRKIINKVELTRLQREFESHANEINKLEISKITGASTAAYIIGVLGTAFMAGSVFAVTSNRILLCIILAIPAFIGWIIPYFCYHRMSGKKSDLVSPLIEEKYDVIFATCEKANALLYK